MHQLLQQLDKIEPCENQTLWRGVSYVPEHVKGDKILYKQFNSTSSKKETALAFANNAIF